jgi:signal transduction histidine kinase/DNA-binding response OmpR family regulator
MNITGFSREELLHLSCTALTDFEERQRSREGIAGIIENGLVDNYQKNCLRKDGSTVPVVMSGALMPDKKRILMTIKDLSIQKAYERELVLAKEAAEHASKVKSEFLSNMSHEIRTPLNGVIGLNTLLLNTPLNERQSDYVKKSLQSSKALLGVINDILDYSKIEAGKLELSTHPFSLETLLHTTTDLFEYAIMDKGLEIHIDYDPLIPEIVEGDSLRLSQILNNLVGNAMKFTERGGITIHALLSQRADEDLGITFSITDTGIGMSPEEINKLFHAFAQTDASNTRKYGGTGLGLVITKQLVEMMGGKIGVESTKGEGSTFYFNVHLKPSKHTTPEELKNRRSPTTEEKAPLRFEGKILLAEDNEVNQLVAQDLLESFGISVEIAKNGAEAIEMCQNTHYDLILMDLQMPIIDGFEASKKIRTFNPSIPIIALSAAVMQRDKELTHKAGMNGHLAKPIDIEELLSVLTRYLRPGETSSKQSRGTMSTLPPIEGIDIEKLRELSLSDEKILSLLKMFASTHQDFCQHLRETPIGSEPFKKMIHTLKGVSGNIAAVSVYPLCVDIEQCKNTTSAEDLVNALCIALTRLIHAIEQSAIQIPASVEPPQISLPEILTMIDAILTKLDTNQYITADEQNTLIGALRYYTDAHDVLNEIDDAINQFDFDHAAKLIIEIKERLRDR